MNLSRNILITGGAGMLAQALRPAAQRAFADHNVLAPNRKELDIADARQLEAFFAQHRPSIVFNCAAYTKVDLAEKERDAAIACNGTAVGRLAQLCQNHRARLIHFSTDYVFDGSVQRPLRPDDPVGPRSAYGESKLLGERYAGEMLEADLGMIVRTAWLYGAGGANFVQTMVNAARAGKPLRVVNDQVGTPTYTVDLADAAAQLAARGASGIWHITNAGQTTWYDFAAAIFEEFDLRPTLSPISSDEWKSTRPDSAIRPRYSVLDVDPVSKMLGRPMRDWRDALRAFHSEVARGG
ncbi:MAG: dTDP-4-dehydrorhamnose reductase [Phycisphaerales bacterium]|jgi:dTDP-4-dehydrorhamnose reductase|nr:dTDP-4-dehydrorhamnose reductase [Phycisphaerales bacterium]